MGVHHYKPINQWINDKTKMTSIRDKVNQLLKSPSKLLLIHKTELQRIKNLKGNGNYHTEYINTLYDHYIINRLSKEQFRQS